VVTVVVVGLFLHHVIVYYWLNLYIILKIAIQISMHCSQWNLGVEGKIWYHGWAVPWMLFLGFT